MERAMWGMERGGFHYHRGDNFVSRWSDRKKGISFRNWYTTLPSQSLSVVVMRLCRPISFTICWSCKRNFVVEEEKRTHWPEIDCMISVRQEAVLISQNRHKLYWSVEWKQSIKRDCFYTWKIVGGEDMNVKCNSQAIEHTHKHIPTELIGWYILIIWAKYCWLNGLINCDPVQFAGYEIKNLIACSTLLLHSMDSSSPLWLRWLLFLIDVINVSVGMKWYC